MARMNHKQENVYSDKSYTNHTIEDLRKKMCNTTNSPDNLLKDETLKYSRELDRQIVMFMTNGTKQ